MTPASRRHPSASRLHRPARSVAPALAAGLLALALGLPAASGQALVFLSEIGQPDAGVVVENPALELTRPQSDGSLYVWVWSLQALDGASFNILSDNPSAVRFTSVEVYNPSILTQAGVDSGLDRWQFTYGGTISPTGDKVAGFQAGIINSGTGLDPNTTTGTAGPDSLRDPLYDAASNVYLFAKVNYRTGSTAGNANLHLQMGVNGVSGSPPPTVYFGGGDDYEPFYSGDPSDRQVSSPIPDATVAFTPVSDQTAPSANKVLVGRSAWGSTFKQALDPSGLGYSVPMDGLNNGQLRPLSWSGMDQISVVFSEPLDPGTIGLGSLTLQGGAQGQLGVSGFNFNPDTLTATWSLASALNTADKLLITLDGITDLAGNPLDLDGWDFRFNVLPGDANGNGSVNSLDLSAVKSKLGTTVGGAGYSALTDVNANGSVNSLDLSFIKSRLGTTLSGIPEPTPGISALGVMSYETRPVPEPATLGLLALLVPALLPRRRRSGGR